MNDIDKYTQQVGLALGPEWQFTEKNDHWGELRTNEQVLSFSNARDPQKYHISLRLTHELGEHAPVSANKHEEIGVSKTKTTQAVAGEIRRRLLPAMEETVRLSVLNKVKYNQATENAEQIAARLQALLPILERNNGERDSAWDIKLSTPYSMNISATVEINGFSQNRQVELSIGRISVEHAAQILRVINSLEILTKGAGDED